MNKILFVTNRNILTTCGELRLIKNRAEVLYSNWNIGTDFIAIAKKSRINSVHEKMDFPCELRTINASRNSISVFLDIKQNIKEMTAKFEYKAIVVSGLFMEKLIPFINEIAPKCKIIADVHGAAEDVLEVSKEKESFHRYIMKCAYFLEKRILRKYLPKADGIFVVSDALKDYLESLYSVQEIPMYRVPCATTNEIMSPSEFSRNRNYYRNKYNVGDDERLFVYSGGVSPWQCIDETIEIYHLISQKINNTKMLLLSHDVSSIDKTILNEANIIVDSYPSEKIEKVLCAGDFAFLIRKNNLTNKVAFPNKFLEYVKSGMRIIATQNVKDVYCQMKRYNLGIILDIERLDIRELISSIEKMEPSNEYRSVVSEVLRINSFDVQLKKFVCDVIFPEGDDSE
ncbi:hypothetical protein ACWOEH_08740 [Enterococcus nangangensis]